LPPKKIGSWVSGKNKSPLIRVPRLYDVFETPEVKAVRAVTSIRANVDLSRALERIPGTRMIRSGKKEVLKFEVERGSYLLLFPNGYVEVHARSEEDVRNVLLAFRNELHKRKLI